MGYYEMKVLHMDSDIPSVYFPIGSLSEGGTCEFSTKKCRYYCPSGGEINEHEKWAYNYFKKHNEETVLKKIMYDYKELSKIPYNAKMIQWFAWGDCPSELTEKVTVCILAIKDEGIPQYGFTRNRRLWEIIPHYDNLSIGLSLDDLDNAKEMSIINGKMTAHPNFQSGYAEMIFNGRIVSKCNGWWCITDAETQNSDCTRCLTNNDGCYSR